MDDREKPTTSRLFCVLFSLARRPVLQKTLRRLEIFMRQESAASLASLSPSLPYWSASVGLGDFSADPSRTCMNRVHKILYILVPILAYADMTPFIPGVLAFRVLACTGIARLVRSGLFASPVLYNHPVQRSHQVPGRGVEHRNTPPEGKQQWSIVMFFGEADLQGRVVDFDFVYRNIPQL